MAHLVRFQVLSQLLRDEGQSVVRKQTWTMPDSHMADTSLCDRAIKKLSVTSLTAMPVKSSQSTI